MASQKVTFGKNGGNRFLEQINILFSAKIKLDILDSKMRMVQGIKAFLIRLIQLFVAFLFRIYDCLNPIFRLCLDNQGSTHQSRLVLGPGGAVRCEGPHRAAPEKF